jgi:hypothetical protein
LVPPATCSPRWAARASVAGTASPEPTWEPPRSAATRPASSPALPFGPGNDLYVGRPDGAVLRYDGVTKAYEGVFVAAGTMDQPVSLMFANVPEPGIAGLAGVAVLTSASFVRRHRARR